MEGRHEMKQKKNILFQGGKLMKMKVKRGRVEGELGSATSPAEVVFYWENHE